MAQQEQTQDVVGQTRKPYDPYPAARRRIGETRTYKQNLITPSTTSGKSYSCPKGRSDLSCTRRIITWYTVDHLTLAEIGRLIGMSKTAVMKRLHKAGITREHGTWATKPCAWCSVEVRRHRRNLSAEQWYCTVEHYYASRENPDFQEWRHGGRLARAIVAQHYPIARGHVVHHKDGNQRNNDRSNLMVFASQADHLAYHHGRTIAPLWDGSQSGQAPPL